MHGSPNVSYTLRTVRGGSEQEAVFRFRYKHFFRYFADGYPGLDRARERLFEPHDADSTHYCAFDESGRLCAVSTAVPAGAHGIPSAWEEWFQLGRLAPLDLHRVVVSTRMVVHPKHRHKGLFDLFYRYIMERYLEAGFDYAVHCCSPGLVCRYELLGHRLYGKAYVVPAGLLRTSMIIALNDPDYLQRVGSPIAGLCADRAARSVATLYALLPELESRTNFRLLTREERLDYVRSRLAPSVLPKIQKILPEIEHASPLRLEAGLSHTAPRGGGFLLLVLSGTIKEGADRIAGPGSLVGADPTADPLSPLPPFTVLADAEVLVFSKTAAHNLVAGREVSDEVMPCGMQL